MDVCRRDNAILCEKGAAPRRLTDARSIGEQPAGLSELCEEQHSGQPSVTGNGGDPRAPDENDRRRDDEHSSRPSAARSLQPSVELRRGTALERLDLNPERLRRALRCSKYELRDPLEARCSTQLTIAG